LAQFDRGEVWVGYSHSATWRMQKNISAISFTQPHQ